jgi:probable F420-dependent oxidoreductase
MTHPRPFRFGVLASGSPSREEWATLARRTEALGYDTLAINEHLDSPLAPIAAIAAAAEVTTRLRVGSCVFANDFRHPVILAKEAASLDVLSDGRFEFGLGTGYSRDDYAQSGIPLDPPGVRVARCAEAVRIIKAAFAGGPVDFAGAHHTVRGFELVPTPVQRPHPPLLLGGGGRRILTLAAQEADIVGINVRATAEGYFDLPSTTPEATAQKVAWVREAAGERFPALELHMLVPFVAVTDEPEPVAAAMLADWGLSELWRVEQLLASPHALIGTEDQIAGWVQERRERYGISYVTVYAPAMEAFAPVVARLAGR